MRPIRTSGSGSALPGKTCNPADAAKLTETCLFTRPTAGTISTRGASGPIYQPGFQNHNHDVSSRTSTITENHRIQFRAEAFNWPNHPNWNGADAEPRSATFGKVTARAANGNYSSRSVISSEAATSNALRFTARPVCRTGRAFIFDCFPLTTAAISSKMTATNSRKEMNYEIVCKSVSARRR